MDEPLSLMARLKRHHIFRVASAYAVAAYILILVANAVFPDIGLSRADVRYIIGALALLFPVALVLGWMFIPPSKQNPDKFSHWQQLRFRVGSVLTVVIVVLVTISGIYLWHANVRYMKSEAVATAKAPSATPAPAAASAIPAKSIAVLPFENLSDEKANAYFAAGMQDMILTKLADIGDLKVIARTSTEHYGSHPDNLKAVAQQLGVATILEGSVQKAGNQVLINVQLIDASTDAHLWAKAYKRTLDNVFDVEGEVAQKVAEALDARLTSAETSRIGTAPTQNPQAYDLFLQGEFYLARAESSLLKAEFDIAAQKYKAAIQQDPQFALAWARLAYALVTQLRFIGEDGSNLAAHAKRAANRALALAPNLAEAHLAQGDYRYDVLNDFDGALDSFNAALKLKPQYVNAIFFIGVIHFHRGQWNAALEAFQRASALDPRNTTVLQEMAITYMFLRRYSEAERVFKQILAIDPSFTLAVVSLAETHMLHTDDLDSAVAVLDAAPPSMQLYPYFVSTRSIIMIIRHDYAAARQLIAKQKPGNGISAGDIESQLGDLEWAAGNQAIAREHYLRAVVLLKTTLKKNAYGNDQPGDLGWVYARLGRTHDALSQGQLGIKLYPLDQDFWLGAIALFDMAKIQAQVGRVDDAVATLDRLLSMSAGFLVSVPMLKLDPTWDSIRNDPRFQALLKKYENTGETPAT